MASPSQLFSCVNSTEIRSSPNNNSSAKQQFSFSHNKRFHIRQPSCDAIYELGKTRTTRSTSMGLGRKTDLDFDKHPHRETPSPEKYQIDSFVDSNEKKGIGCHIHIGREVTFSSSQMIAPRSYIDLEKIKVPGPGRYDELRQNNSPKWSMRPQTRVDLFSKTTIYLVPGSGAYDFRQALNPEGKYQVGKYPGSKSKVWNPPSSVRFPSPSTAVPGSGAYELINDFSGAGKYVLSQYPGAGRRAQAKSKRDSFVDSPARITKTPGPGSYRLPSDFGHYDQLKSKEFEVL